MEISDVVGIVAGLVSIGLGILAIWLSLWFFKQSKQTESNVDASLIKIETQTEMLQKITSKQLDRLTKFVTEPKSNQNDEQLNELLKTFSQLPQLLLAPQPNSTPNNEQNLSLLIALYFYTAQTNWSAASSLPTAEEFDSSIPYHAHIKRIVDMSANDFQSVTNQLSQIDQNKLEAVNTYHLYEETLKNFSGLVKNSSDAFVAKAKTSEQNT
jgi:hypothetical protein